MHRAFMRGASELLMEQALHKSYIRCQPSARVEAVPPEPEPDQACAFTDTAFGCPCRLVTQAGFFEVLEAHEPLQPNLKAALRFADTLAEQAHADKLRRWGEVPVITHPRGVTEILYVQANVRDEIILQAAELHDVLEDDDKFGAMHDQPYHSWRVVAFQNARGLFVNSDLARISLELVEPWIDGDKICDEMQRLAQQRDQLWHAYFQKNERVSDGIKLIKLADRLHNFTTIGPPSPDGPFSLAQQLAKCRDTEQLVLPLVDLVTPKYRPAAAMLAAQIKTYMLRIYNLAEDSILENASAPDLS